MPMFMILTRHLSPHNSCIKYGRSVRLLEALATDFVRQNTNMPASEVYRAFKYSYAFYIKMERLPGWGSVSFT